MKTTSLDIPSGLQRLIDAGVWPDKVHEVDSGFGEEAAHRVSPDDDMIVLMPPPFHTIQAEVDGGNTFWTDGLTNVGEIDYSLALIIADFGLGSDSPIVLYYSTDEPVVMYLKWTTEGHEPKHSWVKTHECFDTFAEDIGLAQQETEPEPGAYADKPRRSG
jgi:hypothetical protein